MTKGQKQMRQIIIVLVVLTYIASPICLGAVAPQGASAVKPCSVRTIYVADFGNDPRHVNFRLFMEKWLSKKKFTVARKPEDADAVLTGKLSISSGNKYSNLTFRDAELTTANGETAWHGNFNITTKNAFGWLGRGHIENGAKSIVENIRTTCK
jgi:hypothetical protein